MADGQIDAANTGSADYLLRTMQQEAVAVRAMADQKANILLGVSALMVTGIVGVLPTVGLTVALVALGTTTVVSATFALLSLLPTVDGATSEANPLFFGHVARLEFDDYRSRMVEVLQTSPTIYDAIVVDLHASSRVLLERKYRFIRYGYQAFLAGLAATVVGVIVDLALGNI